MRRPYAHLRSARGRVHPWVVAMLLFLLLGISYLVVNKQPSTAAVRPTASITTAGGAGP